MRARPAAGEVDAMAGDKSSTSAAFDSRAVTTPGHAGKTDCTTPCGELDGFAALEGDAEGSRGRFTAAPLSPAVADKMMTKLQSADPIGVVAPADESTGMMSSRAAESKANSARKPSNVVSVNHEDNDWPDSELAPSRFFDPNPHFPIAAKAPATAATAKANGAAEACSTTGCTWSNKMGARSSKTADSSVIGCKSLRGSKADLFRAASTTNVIFDQERKHLRQTKVLRGGGVNDEERRRKGQRSPSRNVLGCETLILLDAKLRTKANSMTCFN
mmetsp:Transcript_1010/g.1897  ORF Transcript_1010/g.1897 Transcript_1010/m.1897 type:complete len:274 (-) Transcript_1010:29-850(-)